MSELVNELQLLRKELIYDDDETKKLIEESEKLDKEIKRLKDKNNDTSLSYEDLLRNKIELAKKILRKKEVDLTRIYIDNVLILVNLRNKNEKLGLLQKMNIRKEMLKLNDKIVSIKKLSITLSQVISGVSLDDFRTEEFYEVLDSLSLTKFAESIAITELNDDKIVSLLNKPLELFKKLEKEIENDVFILATMNMDELEKLLKEDEPLSNDDKKSINDIVSRLKTRIKVNSNPKRNNTTAFYDNHKVLNEFFESSRSKNIAESFVSSYIKEYEQLDYDLSKQIPMFDKTRAIELCANIETLKKLLLHIEKIKEKIPDSINIEGKNYSLEEIKQALEELVKYIINLAEKYKEELYQIKFTEFAKAVSEASKIEKTNNDMINAIENKAAANTRAELYNSTLDYENASGQNEKARREFIAVTNSGNVSTNDNEESKLDQEVVENEIYRKLLFNNYERRIALRSEYTRILIATGQEITFKDFLQARNEEALYSIEVYIEQLLDSAYDSYVSENLDISFSNYIAYNSKYKKLFKDFISKSDIEKYEESKNNEVKKVK